VKAFLALLAALGLALAACGQPTPGGPEYAELGISTLDARGGEQRRDCVPLPVLSGGVVDEDLTLAPGLTAHVFAVQDFAEVALGGANDPASSHVTIPKATLRNGYSNPIAATATSGESYTVVLLSPCVPGDGSTN